MTAIQYKITHSDFLSAFFKNAGVTDRASSDKFEEWANNHFPGIFKNKRSDEIIIVLSSHTSFEVNSVDDIKEVWDILHQYSSEEVYVYRLKKAGWFGVQARLRQQENTAELKDTG